MEAQREGVHGPAVMVCKEELFQAEAGFFIQGQGVQMGEDIFLVVAPVEVVQNGPAVGGKEVLIDWIHQLHLKLRLYLS